VRKPAVVRTGVNGREEKVRGANERGANERGADAKPRGPEANPRDDPEANPREGAAKPLLGALWNPELACPPPKLRPPMLPRIWACKESEANNAIPRAIELSRRIFIF
jgi:hypothetical protein